MGKKKKQPAISKSAKPIDLTLRLWLPSWRFFVVEQKLYDLSQAGYRLVSVEHPFFIKHIFHFTKCEPQPRNYYIAHVECVPPKSFSEAINYRTLYREQQELAPFCSNTPCDWSKMFIAELNSDVSDNFLWKKKLLRLKGAMGIVAVYLVSYWMFTILCLYFLLTTWNPWSVILCLPLFALALYYSYAAQRIFSELGNTKRSLASAKSAS